MIIRVSIMTVELLRNGCTTMRVVSAARAISGTIRIFGPISEAHCLISADPNGV